MATETGFTAMNGSRINAATDEAVDMSNDSRRRSHTAGQNVGESESPNTEPGGTPKSTIALLVSYSGLSKDGAARVVEKLTIQKRAQDKSKSYLDGFNHSLDLSLAKHPYYPQVLSHLADGHTFLDASCSFGQDIRQLMVDGDPSSAALFGIDKYPALFETGYRIFSDAYTLQAIFIAEDLGKPSLEIHSLEAKIDVVSAMSLLSGLDPTEQGARASRAVELTKPSPGSTILGRVIAKREAGSFYDLVTDTTVYAHNQESFEQLWREVEVHTNTKWQVTTQLQLFEEGEATSANQSEAKSGQHWLYFQAVRGDTTGREIQLPPWDSAPPLDFHPGTPMVYNKLSMHAF